ncbi:MAG: hypothetical protein KZQ87_12205 [Candidatus Thiodiazotropha sp. (ex Cardiolucina cf. quadrata)]|nr:hypothetical protein [Candidatus Thiodiazotropha sp. (ex Cardiolucina cf. quadrata)]
MLDKSGDQLEQPYRRLLYAGVLCAVICYPFAVHSSVFSGSIIPGLVILIILLALLSLTFLMQHSWITGLLLLLLTFLAIGITLLKGESTGLSLLHTPPIAINLILGLLFASTLLPGRNPLISRFASKIHGDVLDKPTQEYTRSVTQFWVAVFFFMAIESWLMAAFAPHRVWSLFTNFINYLIVLLIFVVEYQIRIRRLAHLKHPGFFRFLLSLFRIDMRSMLRL